MLTLVPLIGSSQHNHEHHDVTWQLFSFPSVPLDEESLSVRLKAHYLHIMNFIRTQRGANNLLYASKAHSSDTCGTARYTGVRPSRNSLVALHPRF